MTTLPTVKCSTCSSATPTSQPPTFVINGGTVTFNYNFSQIPVPHLAPAPVYDSTSETQPEKACDECEAEAPAEGEVGETEDQWTEHHANTDKAVPGTNSREEYQRVTDVFVDDPLAMFAEVAVRQLEEMRREGDKSTAIETAGSKEVGTSLSERTVEKVDDGGRGTDLTDDSLEAGHHTRAEGVTAAQARKTGSGELQSFSYDTTAYQMANSNNASTDHFADDDLSSLLPFPKTSLISPDGVTTSYTIQIPTSDTSESLREAMGATNVETTQSGKQGRSPVPEDTPPVPDRADDGHEQVAVEHEPSQPTTVRLSDMLREVGAVSHVSPFSAANAPVAGARETVVSNPAASKSSDQVNKSGPGADADLRSILPSTHTSLPSRLPSVKGNETRRRDSEQDVGDLSSRQTPPSETRPTATPTPSGPPMSQILPITTERETLRLRKCHLCKTQFTDASNVARDDGSAPCSYHPGECPISQSQPVPPCSELRMVIPTGQLQRAGHGPRWTCCGGGPLTTNGHPILNICSPGCVDVYHQDKADAFDMSTLTVKEPRVFEGRRSRR